MLLSLRVDVYKQVLYGEKYMNIEKYKGDPECVKRIDAYMQ